MNPSTLVSSINPSMLYPLQAALRHLGNTAWRAWRAWQEARLKWQRAAQDRRALAELQEMSERDLIDIGISRSDLPRLTNAAPTSHPCLTAP